MTARPTLLTSTTPSTVSRRRFLRLAGLGIAATSVLAACSAPVPAAPTAAPAKPTEAPKPAAPAAPAAASPATSPAAGASPAASPAAAAAPAAPAAASKPVAKVTPTGTLTYAQQLLPITQDPQIEFVNSSYTYLYSLYEPLTNVDQDGKLQPHLATSWKMDTPTSWVFELRQSMKWHDGSPITSKDVVWSINRILDPETKSPWRSIISNVEGIEALNDFAVRFKLKMTAVSMPSEVARLFVLPKDAYEKMGKDAFFANPIGSGPYKFVKQVKGEMITVEAYEDYYAGAPKIKTLIFKQVPDAATRVAELLAGTADVVDAIPPTDVARIKAAGTVEMLIFPTVRRVTLDFALLTTPEVADKRVRQAVAHAIDRDAINQAVYDGLGGKQTGWFDRFTYGYNKSLQQYAYDPAKSKALLAEAGFPNGMPLTYLVGKGRFLGDEEIALAVADYLNKGGFKVDLKIQEFAVFQAARARKEYNGIYMLSSGNSLGDPDQVLRSLDSKRESIYIKDDQLDALIDKQRGAVEETARLAAIAEVDKYIHENAISLNLMTVPGFYGVSKKVQDWRPSPYEIHTFYGASVK